MEDFFLKKWKVKRDETFWWSDFGTFWRQKTQLWFFHLNKQSLWIFEVAVGNPKKKRSSPSFRIMKFDPVQNVWEDHSWNPKAFMCQSWRISILTKAAWCFGLLEQLMIPESNWSILGVFPAFVHLWKDYEKLPSNFAQAWVFVEWVPKKRLNWFEFSSLV